MSRGNVRGQKVAGPSGRKFGVGVLLSQLISGASEDVAEPKPGVEPLLPQRTVVLKPPRRSGDGFIEVSEATPRRERTGEFQVFKHRLGGEATQRLKGGTAYEQGPVTKREEGKWKPGAKAVEPQ